MKDHPNMNIFSGIPQGINNINGDKYYPHGITLSLVMASNSKMILFLIVKNSSISKKLIISTRGNNATSNDTIFQVQKQLFFL